jgi:DNA-binding MurR/RpiR family transcriptional regulator
MEYTSIVNNVCFPLCIDLLALDMRQDVEEWLVWMLHATQEVKMFRERIINQYQSLSPSYKKIADFVLQSYHKVAFLSASRLAKHLGVDVATVTRFAQHLEYTGYTQFVREVQDVVRAEWKVARWPIDRNLEGVDDPFERTLWQDWINLEDGIRNLSFETARGILDAVRQADRIFLSAEAAVGALAEAFGSYLRMIKPNVVVLRGGLFEAALHLKSLAPGDVVIGLGFTRYAYDATRALAWARKRGATAIGIIAQPDCLITTEAELLLVCSSSPSYMPSLTSMAAVLYALYHVLSHEDEVSHRAHLQTFQDTYEWLTEGTARGDVETSPEEARL